MKKVLLSVILCGFFCLGFNTIANAATVTVTKPTIKVNTSQEETTVSKKLKEIENKQAAAEQQRAKKQAEAKAKQEKAKKDIENKQKELKNEVEKAKAEQKKNQEAAKAKQKQRQDAINSFKNSFK